MGTKIEWTDETWNPISGCSKVSTGCENCYAEAMARRFDKGWKPWTAANAEHNVRLHPERLEQPLHWRKPRRVFVCSMSDLFHEQVPGEFIGAVFAVMAAQAHHTFMLLTKRPRRMLELILAFSANPERIPEGLAQTNGELQCAYYSSGFDPISFPLRNVIPGTSIENQCAADERIPLLLHVVTPAAVRGVSIEPMLEPVDLSPWLGTCLCGKGFYAAPELHSPACHRGPCLDWVILGGESGPKARPMHPDWVRSIRDQCQAAGVPFFFKGWGEWAPNDLTGRPRRAKMVTLPPEAGKLHGMFKVGKKAAGRELDGRTWEEFP